MAEEEFQCYVKNTMIIPFPSHAPRWQTSPCSLSTAWKHMCMLQWGGSEALIVLSYLAKVVLPVWAGRLRRPTCRLIFDVCGSVVILHVCFFAHTVHRRTAFKLKFTAYNLPSHEDTCTRVKIVLHSCITVYMCKYMGRNNKYGKGRLQDYEMFSRPRKGSGKNSVYACYSGILQ